MNPFERSELLAASRIAVSVLDQADQAAAEYAADEDRDAATVALVACVVDILSRQYVETVQ